MKISLSPFYNWISLEFLGYRASFSIGCHSRKFLEITYLSLLKKLRIESKFFSIILANNRRKLK
jgi:hypothetical protein